MNLFEEKTGGWKNGIRRHKKWVIIGAVITLVLIWGVSSKFKAVQAVKVSAAVTDVTSTVVEKGTIVSNDTGEIYSEVQGKVKAVYADEGQAVKEGQVLAEIDVGDIQSQIAQLEGQLKAIQGSEQAASYQNGQNQVRQQQLAVEQATVAFNLAQTTYDRMQQLFDQGAVTLSDLEQAKADLQTKKKSLEQAQFSLKSTQGLSQGSKIQYQGQRESILAQLEQLRTQQAKARIVADDTAVVFARKIKTGDYVTPGTMLFALGSKANMKIETYVASKDTAYLKIGDEVSLTFKLPGQDEVTTGQISSIAPAAENVVSALGISEPKIKVTVELPKSPAGIKVIPGAAVDVTLTTRYIHDALAIPKEALFSDNGKDYVWVVDNGTAALTQVQKGPEGDDLTVIKSGLTKGDVVLLNPHQQELQPGVRIK